MIPEDVPGSDSEEVQQRDYKVEVGGKLFDVKVFGEAGPTRARQRRRAAPPAAPRARPAEPAAAASSESLPSPLQGTVLRVAVEPDQEVEEGALICVIEAMKMENEITAHRSGKVTELGVSEGASVSSGDVIAVIS